jgi:hypothetical protein
MKLEQRRTQAWSELLARPDTFPTAVTRDALQLARQNVGVEQRARAARAACSDARDAVAKLQRSLNRPGGPAMTGIAREWVSCLADLLALADRACAVSVEYAEAA